MLSYFGTENDEYLQRRCRSLNCCCEKFDRTIHYVSPSHGGWGVVRIAALLPESHQLFVSPFACGRHGALGGALNGIKDRISYLYIDESDIVSGNYENLIFEAVDELFVSIPKKPKVLLLFVSCLDDLLGTDHVSLNRRLAEKHSDVKFITCHMNPIKLDTDFPPGITLQNNIYSLLEKSEEEIDTINLIGNNVPISEKCELFEMLRNSNFALKHLTDFSTFSEFQSMGKSKLNLVLSPVANYAAQTMEKKLGIKSLSAYCTYDLEEIEAFYENLSLILRIEIKYQDYARIAEEAIRNARKEIGEKPIAIDYQAVKKPFTLARMLLKYGFNVSLIMTDTVKNLEREAYDDIVNNYPKVEIFNAIHYNMSIRKEKEFADRYLCIGFDCAYFTSSRKIVNIADDEGLFGYYGVVEMMRMMVEANRSEVDLQKMIEGAKLII